MTNGSVGATATRRGATQEKNRKKRDSECSRSTPEARGSSYRDGGTANRHGGVGFFSASSDGDAGHRRWCTEGGMLSGSGKVVRALG